MEIISAKVGVEIRGINLVDPVPQKVIDQIKSSVHTHRVLVFRDQGRISGDRQVEITRWFGEAESSFLCHRKSPHVAVYRLSNDKTEGFTNVGRTGWHIDGTFMPTPCSHSLYHIVHAPKTGDTAFVPLTELIESLTPETRERWERLSMVSDRRSGLMHPLIYPHPVTKKPTLCFHLGMTEGFVQDTGSEEGPVPVTWQQYEQIMKEIHNEIVKDNRRLIYSHKWEEGDFIISDNLAVGHEATPETQKPREEVGLRVLHRTTVKGKWVPKKSVSES